jgi:hypothetical protein
MNSILYYVLLCVMALLLIGLIQYVDRVLDELEKPMKDDVWRMRSWKLKLFSLIVGLAVMIPVLLAATIKAVVLAYLWL